MRSILALSLMFGVAACGGGLPDDAKQTMAQQKAAKAEAAKRNALAEPIGTASFQGAKFSVARHPDGHVLVTAIAESKVTATFLEEAAASASGCPAAFNPGILAFVPGYDKQMPLPMTKGQSLRVDVTC